MYGLRHKILCSLAAATRPRAHSSGLDRVDNKVSQTKQTLSLPKISSVLSRSACARSLCEAVPKVTEALGAPFWHFWHAVS